MHRDLKPSNVFLTAHGVKLLDFGVARPVDGGYYPFVAMLRDQWLDALRGDTRMTAILRRAESRYREAQAAFLEANGNRLLGMTAS